MKTSIASLAASGSLQDKLAAIAAAGFDGIEIFEQNFLASDSTPAEVGRMVRDHGLAITFFQPFRDFEGLPEPARARAFTRAPRRFDLMNELGTDLVLAARRCIPKLWAALTGWGQISKNRGVWPRVRAFASAMRPWPGAAISTITAMPGRWCAAPITPISG